MRYPLLLRALPMIIPMLLAVSACDFGKADYKDSSTRALQQSDVNYPKKNSSPKKAVQFTAIIPDGFPKEFLPKEFHLIYIVEYRQDERNHNNFISPKGCAWTDEKQFYIDIPIALSKQSGNRYVGEFAADQFQRGSCNWHLDRITIPIVRSPIIFFGHSFHSNIHPRQNLDLEKSTIHIWCTENSRGQIPAQSSKLNERINCAPFDMSSMFTDLPLDYDEVIPNEQKEWNIHANQYLRSLTVEFHNLDMLIPVYRQTHHLSD